MTDSWDVQVSRHWLSAYSILQLPQFAEVQGLRYGQIYGRGGVAK